MKKKKKETNSTLFSKNVGFSVLSFYDGMYIHSNKIVFLFNFDKIMRSKYQSILLILK